MKILVTGGDGQLGCELRKQLDNVESKKNIYFFATHNVLDITSEDEVNRFIDDNKIDVVVNCAAYTNVDGCETNYDTAYMINSIGPRFLANAIKKNRGTLIHISTDYVFDGKRGRPYFATDETNPTSVYGRSKEFGEQLIKASGCNYIIIRTSWLYGGNKKNFVKTMFDLMETKDELKVVSDQKGTPTYVEDLAHFLVYILECNLLSHTGTYHFANTGVTSWYELTKKIYEYRKEYDENFKHECKITPITTDEYPSKVNRPKFSPLNVKSTKFTFGCDTRKWDDALKDCIIKYINKKKNENITL